MKDSDMIDESNVEEAIEKAITKYFDIGMITDGMFWRFAINLLKSKYQVKP